MGTFCDIQPPVGADPENDVFMLICHAAIAKGSVVAIDRSVLNDDGSTTLSPPTGVGTRGIGLWTKTRAPVAADVSTGLFAVALDTYASGAIGQFCIRGRVDAKLAADLTAVAGTDRPCFAGTSGALTLTVGTEVTGATGVKKIIAYAANGASVTAASQLCPVYFNGYEGFGNNIT